MRLIKLSIMVLSIIALVTGFTTIGYIQSVHAFSLDVGDIHMNFDNSQGSTGSHGSPGPKGDTGPQGPHGGPCPYQSQLISPASGGIAVVHPTPGENPFNVCVL